MPSRIRSAGPATAPPSPPSPAPPGTRAPVLSGPDFEPLESDAGDTVVTLADLESIEDDADSTSR